MSKKEADRSLTGDRDGCNLRRWSFCCDGLPYPRNLRGKRHGQDSIQAQEETGFQEQGGPEQGAEEGEADDRRARANRVAHGKAPTGSRQNGAEAGGARGDEAAHHHAAQCDGKASVRPEASSEARGARRAYRHPQDGTQGDFHCPQGWLDHTQSGFDRPQSELDGELDGRQGDA